MHCTVFSYIYLDYKDLNLIRINGVSSHFLTNSSDMGTDPQVWAVCKQIPENRDRKSVLSLFAFLDLFLYC
jgi:hypothetical protein